MKPLVFPITKAKVNKKIITIVIIVAIFLLVAGGYSWLQRTGRVPEFNLGGYLQELTAGLTKIGQREAIPEEKTLPEELEITLPSVIKTYEQTAQPGEGITHLARKALKEYLKEKGGDLNLTPEHKIYIEDYIQKKTGDRLLELGEKITFSEELITEAINKSQQLTGEQLENLKQYSSQVISL